MTQTTDKPRRPLWRRILTGPTNKPKRPLRLRILKWTIRAVVLLLVLGLLTHTMWNYIATRRLDAELARIRAAGEPTTFGELARSVKKYPAAEDAAPFYAAAMELLRRDLYDRVDRLDARLPSDPNLDLRPAAPLLAEMHSLTDQDHLTLEMLDRGSARPGCNFDLGLRYGLIAAMDKLPASRAVARASSRRTRLLAFQGDGNAAAESAVSALRMLRMFDDQPILVAHFVKMGCQSLTVSDIEIVLRYGRPSAEALTKLEQALRQAEDSFDLRRVFQAERVYALEICRSAVFSLWGMGTEDSYMGPAQMPGGWWAEPMNKTMTIGILRVDAQFIELVGKGWPAMADGVSSVARSDTGSWPFNMFAEISAAGLDVAITTSGRVLATLRSARVAVLIERYRLQKQQLPAGLEELSKHFGQELPADPFTGKGLIYRQEPGGYVVYSVGDDRKDDQAAKLGQTDWGVRVRQ